MLDQKIYANKDRTMFGVYDSRSDQFEILHPIGVKDVDVAGGGTIKEKISPVVEKVAKNKKKSTGGKGNQRICSICGVPGHHAKTCKERPSVIPGVIDEYRHKATEEDIARIHEIREAGGKSHEAALELKLHLAVVNKHWID